MQAWENAIGFIKEPMAFCAMLQFCVFRPILEGQLQDPNGVANADASEMPLFDKLASRGASNIQDGGAIVNGVSPGLRQGFLFGIFLDNLHNFTSS